MPCITYRTTELYCETLKIQCTFDCTVLTYLLTYYTVCDTSSPSQKAIVTDAVDTSSSLDSSHEDQSPVCNGYSFGSLPTSSRCAFGVGQLPAHACIIVTQYRLLVSLSGAERNVIVIVIVTVIVT